MDSTAVSLARVNAFARAMTPELPAVDVALEDLRQMLERAGAAYVLVGGLAVIHHGYVRSTRDIDLLLERATATRLEALLVGEGFEQLAENRWRHHASGVDVDLFFAGDPIPPAERDRFPAPADLGRSARERDVVDLTGLVSLKLRAGRHRDVADVVELLQHLDEGEYVLLEAATAVDLRPQLFRLRVDALEELRWRERPSGASRS